MPTHIRQHCFPDLSRTPSATSRQVKDSCAQFQSITHYPSMDGGNPAGDAATIEMAEAIEQACQNGYDAGLIDGQEEGLKIAHDALSPTLVNYTAAYDNMIEYIPEMADIMGTQIVQLTGALVERVLGKETALAKQDLDNLHTSIVEKILHSHRLMIRIHPEDAGDIAALAKVLNRGCPDGCDVVSFSSDPDQPRGQLSMEMADHDFTGDVNELADLIPGFGHKLSDPIPKNPA